MTDSWINRYAREWLSIEESDSSFVYYKIERDCCLPDNPGYVASLTIGNEENIFNFCADIFEASDKQAALHKIRKLKQAINNFYLQLKDVPDSNLAKEEKQEE